MPFKSFVQHWLALRFLLSDDQPPAILLKNGCVDLNARKFVTFTPFSKRLTFPHKSNRVRFTDVRHEHNASCWHTTSHRALHRQHHAYTSSPAKHTLPQATATTPTTSSIVRTGATLVHQRQHLPPLHCATNAVHRLRLTNTHARKPLHPTLATALELSQHPSTQH